MKILAIEEGKRSPVRPTPKRKAVVRSIDDDEDFTMGDVDVSSSVIKTRSQSGKRGRSDSSVAAPTPSKRLVLDAVELPLRKRIVATPVATAMVRSSTAPDPPTETNSTRRTRGGKKGLDLKGVSVNEDDMADTLVPTAKGKVSVADIVDVVSD
jgi:hypothetical protein